MAKTLDKTLNTRPKLFVASAASLLISYLFVSLAIDSGSLFHYFLGIVFLVFAVKYLIRSLKTHGNK